MVGRTGQIVELVILRRNIVGRGMMLMRVSHRIRRDGRGVQGGLVRGPGGHGAIGEMLNTAGSLSNAMLCRTAT